MAFGPSGSAGFGFGGGSSSSAPIFAIPTSSDLTTLSTAQVGSLALVTNEGTTYVLSAYPPGVIGNWTVLPSGGGSRPRVWSVANVADLVTLTSALQGDVAIVSAESKSFILAATPPTTLSNWNEILSPAGSTIAATQSSYLNSTGVTIPAFVPVQVDSSSGTLARVDVSSIALSADTFGLTTTAIASGTSGNVVMDGRVQNIGGSWSFGDSLWIDKSGNLTNVAPNSGVNGFTSGDAVVRVGTVVANASTSSLRDLVVDVDLVGIL